MAPPLVVATRVAGLRTVLAGASGRRRNCFTASCLACAGCLATVATAFAAVLATFMSGLAGNACEQQSCALGAVFGAPMTCARMWVSQGFGDTRWEHPHRGIDIVCPPGTSVAAVAEGVFRRRSDLSGPCPFVAGKHGGYGWFGALELGGRLEIVYGHLAGFAATDGATVAAGTVLGYEGTSGCSSGYHLHFEVRSSGVAVNPCPFLPSGYPVQHQGDRCWDSRAS